MTSSQRDQQTDRQTDRHIEILTYDSVVSYLADLQSELVMHMFIANMHVSVFDVATIIIQLGHINSPIDTHSVIRTLLTHKFTMCNNE